MYFFLFAQPETEAPSNAFSGRQNFWKRWRWFGFLLGLWMAVAPCEGAAGGVAPGAESEAEVAAVESAVARINELRAEIARHDDLYFRLNAPEISDFEYDQLKAELKRLEGLYPDEDYSFLPVEPVGDDRTGGFATYRHRAPMLSLDKAMSQNELLDFNGRMEEVTGGDSMAYWIEPKVDGMAVSLTYERGRLVRALTRGNGIEGEDITANVRRIEGVPNLLQAETGGGNGVPELIEIRGEIFISFAEFARVNTEQTEAGEPVFANPRNLAAGTAKLHDPSAVAERGLELVCFGWGAFEPAASRPVDMAEFGRRLKAWGLPVPVGATRADGHAEMSAAVRKIRRLRENFPFAIDGAVVKLFATANQDLLGFSPSAPQWAVAVKFPPERVSTRLLGITLQVGRTGVVTPVAELEEVQLAGSRVSRASLHNAAEIARRDLRIGDLVYLEKAGDIIPAVVGVDKSRRTSGASEPYMFPAKCPECDAPLDRVEGRAAIYCVNERCPARVGRQLEHFAAALNIRGLGPATVAAFVDECGVGNPADLYRLQRDDLLAVSGIGDRSAENLLGAIQASRKEPWERVIHAIGIPGVGLRRAGALAQTFADFGDLGRASVAQLTLSKAEGGAGFGEATAKTIREHLVRPQTQGLLMTLDSLGFTGGGVKAMAALDSFAGEVVVVTGRLEGWTRTEITSRLAAAGATIRGDVSGETTLLVVGERPGSKLVRAEALGVAIIDEAELGKRLGEKPR